MPNDDKNFIKVETVSENPTEEDDGNPNANGEDKNMDNLLSAFGGDDFMSAEEKEAAAAAERRRKRKRRLQTLEASADSHQNEIPTKITKKEIGTSEKRPEITYVNQFKSDSTALAIEKEDAQANSPADDDSDSDGSDMFGSSSSEGEDDAKEEKKKSKKKSTNVDGRKEAKTEASRQDGFDDTDGYYKASIGETMELEVLGGGSIQHNEEDENKAWKLKLRVLGVIGKGVFSSVLKCSTTSDSTHVDGIPSSISLPGGNDGQQEQHGLPNEVAIKCIRSNETMAKAALDEMKFLIRLRESPGIVPLLLPAPPNIKHNTEKTYTNPNYVPPSIDFRGHTILVFPYLPYNLRDVLQKFGKGVGLSLGAVQNYYRQLLSAAIHLQKHGVIHADIKPDNILVSADFSKVVIADFGSAFESRIVHTDDEDTNAIVATNAQSNLNEAVTPYLVSRFYRAPEIILGIQPLTYAIDLWSLAVTAGELFLGKVLLQGANNNGMIKAMMELLGPFSARTIKNHIFQTKKHPLQAHFAPVQSNFVFKQESIDPVLGKPVHKEISLASNAFKATLQTKLLRAKSPSDTRTDILAFADLLTKCLVLDPSKRISVKGALKHKFFVQQQQQQRS